MQKIAQMPEGVSPYARGREAVTLESFESILSYGIATTRAGARLGALRWSI